MAASDGREVLDALCAGIEQGVLRADLDVQAAFDLIAGVFYHQLVMRGERVDESATHARCRAALDVAWRGMLPDPEHRR